MFLVGPTIRLTQPQMNPFSQHHYLLTNAKSKRKGRKPLLSKKDIEV